MSHLQQIALDPLELLPSLPAAEITCQYMTDHGHDCGTNLPADSRLVSAHLRNEHALGGGRNSKERIACLWRDCDSRPLQRQSLVRHILSVHLGLLRWDCPLCAKTFARKGTAHNCHLGGEMPPHA